MCLPWIRCFCQNNHLRTYRMLFPPSRYSTQHYISSQNPLHSKWTMAMGPWPWNSPVLTMFPTILKHLAWQNRRMPIWRLRAPGQWQYFAGLEWGSSRVCICPKLASDIWCCFSHSQDSQVQVSKDENRSGTTHYHFEWPTSKILLVVPMTLCSSGLKVLVPKRGMSLLKQTNKKTATLILLNWNLKLPPRNAGLFMSLSQQAKKGVTIWDWSWLLRRILTATPQWR